MEQSSTLNHIQGESIRVPSILSHPTTRSEQTYAIEAIPQELPAETRSKLNNTKPVSKVRDCGMIGVAPCQVDSNAGKLAFSSSA